MVELGGPAPWESSPDCRDKDLFSRVTEIGLYFAAVARNCLKSFPRHWYKILQQKRHKINGGDSYFHR